jgi:hypothetical protein
MTKMKIAVVLAVLVICPLASGDYYCHFTQIDVQPRLGRIAIHRSLVRDDKYVDWMCENRKQLRRDGIYVDADLGGVDVFNRTIQMDGQRIELELRSEHTKLYGRGSALPSNSLKITIDGVPVYVGLIGLARYETNDVSKIEIIPIDHMVQINASECVIAEQGSLWVTSKDLYFFYGDQKENTVCDMEWVSTKISS